MDPTHHAPEREQAMAFRIASHHLAARLPAGALLTAAGVCAVQNTPPGAAALSLHARLEGLAPGEIETCLVGSKTLLQAWSLRAAPHIFPMRDAAVFTLGLTPADEAAARALIFGVEPALEKIGIAALELIALCEIALMDELDGQARTKDELGVALAERIAPQLTAKQRQAWMSPSWYAPKQRLGESAARFALPVLALRGVCCHAERRGIKAYIRRSDQWLGAPLPVEDTQPARAELVRRYLTAYGPTNAGHFAAWAGIGPSQAEDAWEQVRDELVQVEHRGQPTWLLRADLPRLESPPKPHGVRLLPAHDPFLQLRDRATLVPDPQLQRRIWRSAGSPGVVLADGRLAAVWRAKKTGQRLQVSVEAFESLSAGLKADIEAEASPLAPFKECKDVEVAFIDVSKSGR